MAKRERTAHDVLHEYHSRSPEYRREYAKERIRLELMQAFLEMLDGERDEQSISKSELARRAGMAPESVRRLFTTKSPNPELNTVIQLADALDLDIVLQPRVQEKVPTRRARAAASRKSTGASIKA